jgi:acyl-CoA thioesterase-2
MVTSLYPHGQSFWQPAMQVASLDHVMYFHRSFRMDDWLLYAMQSPNACKARGLAFGKIYTQEGLLVATVAQEGLIRHHGPK